MAILRARIHACSMLFAVGNGGLFWVRLAMYCLNISAVFGLSRYIPLACCFVPITDISPLSRLIWLCLMFVSSWGSMPVSAMMVKTVVYFHVDILRIFCTCSRVGIIGMG